MIGFTLDQLMALDAIVRTGSFAKAAEALHKVPSAVSYNVQGLEDALGVPLFDRTRRKAELTRAGRRLLEASREVIDRAYAMERIAAELREGWESELHVVVDGALPMGPITRCVRRFADPEIPTCLRVDVEYQEGVLDRFNGAKADLSLMLGFDGDGDEVGYTCTPLPDLTMMLVCAPEHPMATLPFNAENRAAHAELVVRDSSPRFGVQPKGSFMGSRNIVYLSDFHSKRIALVGAAGYGWIPRHFIADDLTLGRLQLIDHEPNQWTYHPQIILREGEHLGRGGQLFVDTLQEGLKAEK
jgi:DNA-binding transcriptional LysR family regulator